MFRGIAWVAFATFWIGAAHGFETWGTYQPPELACSEAGLVLFAFENSCVVVTGESAILAGVDSQSGWLGADQGSMRGTVIIDDANDLAITLGARGFWLWPTFDSRIYSGLFPPNTLALNEAFVSFGNPISIKLGLLDPLLSPATFSTNDMHYLMDHHGFGGSTLGPGLVSSFGSELTARLVGQTTAFARVDDLVSGGRASLGARYDEDAAAGFVRADLNGLIGGDRSWSLFGYGFLDFGDTQFMGAASATNTQDWGSWDVYASARQYWTDFYAAISLEVAGGDLYRGIELGVGREDSTLTAFGGAEVFENGSPNDPLILRYLGVTAPVGEIATARAVAGYVMGNSMVPTFTYLQGSAAWHPTGFVEVKSSAEMNSLGGGKATLSVTTRLQ